VRESAEWKRRRIIIIRIVVGLCSFIFNSIYLTTMWKAIHQALVCFPYRSISMSGCNRWWSPEKNPNCLSCVGEFQARTRTIRWARYVTQERKTMPTMSRLYVIQNSSGIIRGVLKKSLSRKSLRTHGSDDAEESRRIVKSISADYMPAPLRDALKCINIIKIFII